MLEWTYDRDYSISFIVPHTEADHIQLITGYKPDLIRKNWFLTGYQPDMTVYCQLQYGSKRGDATTSGISIKWKVEVE